MGKTAINRLAVLALALVSILTAGAAVAQDKEWSITSLSEEISGLTETVSPCVVQIYTSSFGALMGSVPQGAARFGSIAAAISSSASSVRKSRGSRVM